MSSMADAVGMGVSVGAATASFTARVVFHDEDTGALRLVRHNVSVTASGSADEEKANPLGGDVESHSYPPIYLALPQGEENDDAELEDAFARWEADFLLMTSALADFISQLLGEFKVETSTS